MEYKATMKIESVQVKLSAEEMNVLEDIFYAAEIFAGSKAGMAELGENKCERIQEFVAMFRGHHLGPIGPRRVVE